MDRRVDPCGARKSEKPVHGIIRKARPFVVLTRPPCLPRDPMHAVCDNTAARAAYIISFDVAHLENPAVVPFRHEPWALDEREYDWNLREGEENGASFGHSTDLFSEFEVLVEVGKRPDDAVEGDAALRAATSNSRHCLARWLHAWHVQPPQP